MVQQFLARAIRQEVERCFPAFSSAPVNVSIGKAGGPFQATSNVPLKLSAAAAGAQGVAQTLQQSLADHWGDWFTTAISHRGALRFRLAEQAVLTWAGPSIAESLPQAIARAKILASSGSIHHVDEADSELICPLWLAITHLDGVLEFLGRLNPAAEPEPAGNASAIALPPAIPSSLSILLCSLALLPDRIGAAKSRQQRLEAIAEPIQQFNTHRASHPLLPAGESSGGAAALQRFTAWAYQLLRNALLQCRELAPESG
ncbi:MAG: hypothetical protein IPM61_11935 [Chlorobi bacterium]|nr:hypothetical protein [Chlorobiota bacterium]MBX7215340.1 hypothetical protein [Candidatus Kapabacteria bacterium]